MSKSSEEIKTFVAQFNRAVSEHELKSVGGFTQVQIELAVRENVLVWRRDGNLDLAAYVKFTMGLY